MAYKTNIDAQAQYAPTSGGEPFLKGIPREKLFLPKEGQYRIRLLPAWSKAGYFAKRVTTHWEVGLAKTTMICPSFFKEGSCPFCVAFGTMRGEYDKYRIDIDSGVRPAVRYYSNIVDVSRPDLGVCVWSYGSNAYKMIMGLQQSGEYGDITDALNGFDLTLTKSGNKQNPIVVFPSRQPTPLQNPNWLDQVFDLDNIFVQPDPATVESAFRTHPFRVFVPSHRASRSEAETVAPLKLFVPPEEKVEVSSPVTTAGTSSISVKAEEEPQKKNDLDELRARLKAKMQK